VNGSSVLTTYTGNGWNHSRIWPVNEEGAASHPENIGKNEESARQCINFIHSLGKGQQPLSGLEEGYSALEITRQIAAAVGRF
jgi:hypothetical protein